MSNHYFDDVISRLRALGDEGTLRLDDGTLLINENRDRKPGEAAYWNVIHRPLTDEEVARLEVRVARKLPASLRDLYRHANGGALFLKSFSWRGLREDYSRDPKKWLPVSLEYGNTIDRPLEGPPGHERFADNSNEVRFGIYVEADAEVMMRLDGDPKVYAVPRQRIGPELYEWPDLETFFTTEVDRMIAQHKNGLAAALCPLLPPWSGTDPAK